ncbi:MAG: hypothetical protein ACM3SY_21615 [Candidatus Omnitrophota bacterium]
MRHKIFGKEHLRKRISILFCLFPLFLIFTGCIEEKVPKSEYDKLKADYKGLETQYKQVLKKLNSLEMVTRSELIATIKEMNNTINEMKETRKESIERAYAQGRYDLSKNIRFIGTPSEDGWWIFKKYYFTFKLYVDDIERDVITVQTENKESPVTKVIGTMADISQFQKLK